MTETYTPDQFATVRDWAARLEMHWGHRARLYLACMGGSDEHWQAFRNPEPQDAEEPDAVWLPPTYPTGKGRAKPVQSPFNQEMAQSCWDQGFAAFHDGGPSNPYTSVAYAAAWRDGWEAAADELADHSAKEAK